MHEFPHTHNFDSDLREILEMYLTVKDLPKTWETYKQMMDTEFAELKAFVNDYFDNLNVQNEINNKIDSMVNDGTMNNIIRPFFNEYNQELNVLKARMDTFTKLEEGSTTGDAELMDGRTDYTGKTWDNIGSHIRGVTSELSSEIVDNLGSHIFKQTDKERAIQIKQAGKSGDVIYFDLMEWGGEYPSCTLYGYDDTLNLVPIFTLVNPQKTTYYTLTQNFRSFLLTVNTDIPTVDTLLKVKFFVRGDKTVDDNLLTAFDEIEKLNNNAKKITDITCFCPTIYAVVGHEINVYYHNIFKCDNIEEYEIKFSVNYLFVTDWIRALEDCIRITPTSNNIGNHTMQIFIIKNGVTLQTYTFNLVVVAENRPTIKAMFIGDSITQNALYISECAYMMNGKMTLYGTMETVTHNSAQIENNITIKHEGRGGWSSSNYLNNTEYAGKTNAFYNGTFDFPYYMNNNPNFADLTDVFILLGANESYSNPSDVASNIQYMINSIKSYNANIRVHVGLQMPPCKDRYAQGTTTVFNVKNGTWELTKYLAEHLANCTFIPYNATMDCWYGYSREVVKVASKLSATVERPTDWLHPSEGNYQMAETVFAEILANCK